MRARLEPRTRLDFMQCSDEGVLALRLRLEEVSESGTLN
jgi:hypothetical protein